MSDWFKGPSGNDKELELLGKIGLIGGTLVGLSMISDYIEELTGDEVPNVSSVLNQAGSTGGSIVDGMDLLCSLAAFGGAGLGAEGLRRYYKKQAKQRIEYFQIIPHAETKVQKDLIVNLVNSLNQMNRTKLDRIKKGREWFQLYFVCVDDPTRGEDGRIEIYCGFPRDRFSYMKKKLQQSFPQCGLKRTHWTKVPTLSDQGLGGYIRYYDRAKAGFPLKEFGASDQIGGIIDHLSPGSAFAVTFSPATPQLVKKTIDKTRKKYYKTVGYNPKEMKKSDLDPDIRNDLDKLDIRSKKSRAFNVKLSVWQEKDRYGDTVSSICDELNSRIGEEAHGFRLNKKSRNPIQIVPYSLGIFDFLESWFEGIPFVNLESSMVWLSSELANLSHLPAGMTAEQRAMKKKHLYDRIDHIIPGQSDIPHDEFTKGVHFGYLLNPVQDYRSVHLLEDVMRKMGVIIGKTGSGKTAIALMACMHVILERLQRKNGGLTIVDPKRTFAYTLLTWINKLKIEGVLTEEQESLFRFYDVTSKEYCFSINPMEKPSNRKLSEEEKMEIVNNTLEVMLSTYPNDSILFERYGTVAIKALLEDRQQHNLLAIAEFIDKESPLRNRLYNYLKNGDSYQKGIAREIERLQKGFGATECQTVYNRLHRLASNPRTKRIFGQSKTTIKPLECMEKGLISVYNVEGLSQSEIKLVMGYIAMEYHKWANHRKNRAENHYLWIDEAHEIQLPVFWEKIIPKDREMGLCLWLLTQSIHQFKEPLLNALKEIGGSFVSCIAGEESARVIEKITTGRVKASDIQNYRALTGVVDTEDSQGDRVTFMVKSDPPFVWDHEGKTTYYGSDRQKRDDEKNAAYENAWLNLGLPWMERDCRPVDEVDKEISDYMESLWKLPSQSIRLTNAETAAAKENNVVTFRPNKEKETETEAKTVNENPFSRLQDKEEAE